MQPQAGGTIAQLVEQRTENPCVAGSIPAGTTKSPDDFIWAFFMLSFLKQVFYSVIFIDIESTGKPFVLFMIYKLYQTQTLMENMDDDALMTHIKTLTERQEQLYGNDVLTDAEVEELHKIKPELDQNWDLLRQRRALRDAGEDPNRASIRSEKTIEDYEE